MKTVYIKFGGFYNSLHSGNVDSMIEGCYIGEYEDYLPDNFYSLDFPYAEIHQKYIEEYMGFMRDYIKGAFELDIKFHNIRLDSPREYNFRTDEIEAEISDINAKKLIRGVKGDDFIEWLKEVTKSRSGFISLYNHFEVLANQNDVLIQYVFNYIMQDEEVAKEWEQYYDFHCIYEMLQSGDILLPKLSELEEEQ